MRVLVPIKNLNYAKERLSSLLNPFERTALFQKMLEDLLAVLSQQTHIADITLVSDDPFASALSRRYGTKLLSERYLCAYGLSDTIQKAVNHLAQEGGTDVMVIHGDLPLITNEEISDLIQRHYQLSAPAVTLSPDRHGTGTNCILANTDTGFTFDYGENSLSRHRVQGLNQGAVLQVIEHKGTGCDIDYPDDLERFLNVVDNNQARLTHKFLLDSNIPARLRRCKNYIARQKWASPAVQKSGAAYAI